VKSIKKQIQIFAVVLIGLHFATSKALAFDAELSQAFASFIETMYMSVQTTSKGSSICVYGNDDISLRFQSRTKLVVFLETDITSKKNHYSECRIIYVARDSEKFVKSFISTFNRSGALTVATFDSFTNDGGMVFIDLGRRDFELTLNTQAFKGSGAKLDSSITALIINNKSRQ
jgi:YfiR/HmsC-like